MSRRCELTAKGPLVGHKVSHSNIKTKRRFLPNLCNVTFISDVLGRNVRLRVSTNAIKSVDHNGGLDTFLLKAKADKLSPRALELKRAIEKKKAAAPEAEGELSFSHPRLNFERPGRKPRPFCFAPGASPRAHRRLRLAPRAGRGRRALARRVRGTLRESNSWKQPLTPTLLERASLVSTPRRAGRGRSEPVARMERSAIRGDTRAAPTPDFASLHPGYGD